MFDWNDRGQVGDTIWAEFSESEDHIVPYPKETEENTFFTVGNYNKNQKNEDISIVARTIEQTSEPQSAFPGCSLETGSMFNTDEELSAPRLDMDTWPDLPSLNTGLIKGTGNDHDSLGTDLIDVFDQASNLNKARVQLDGEPELFGNGHEDKESDSLLDCDWANIEDFNDLDRIFRNNDSIFGHEMVVNVEELFSPPTDVIGSTARSIPLPDIPLSRDQPSDQDYSSFQFSEHPDGKRKREETADSSVETREQMISQTHIASGMQNQFSGKDDRQRKVKSQKKAEIRSKNQAPQELTGLWSQKISRSQKIPCSKVHPPFPTTLQTFQSPSISQQVGDGESTGHLGSSNSFMFSGYGCPTYQFPSIPLQQHAQAERNQGKTVAIGHKFYPDPLKNSNILNKVQDAHSGPMTMTPQEKIEKLRRRQQMQAMLAIQQQQQQFGHQITVNDNLVSQSSSQKNQSQDTVTSNMEVEESANKHLSSDMNTLVEYDQSHRMATLTDDNSLEETIYYQLQDALGKLDNRVRLSIRDSLFRLAKSSMERQSASDRSSTNQSTIGEEETPANGERNNRKRCTRLPDEEADTNPIDRTVANLLFYRSAEQCTKHVKDDILSRPFCATPRKNL